MTSTIKDMLADLIGTYVPLGTGFSGIDFEYIFSGIIFCICLIYTFKFMYGFFCGLMNRRW